MSIAGLGLDLLEIDRMEKLMSSEAFLRRVFLPRERAYLLSKGTGAARTAAGLFCAKEALAKATGEPLLRVLRSHAVEHGPDGRPYFDLPGVFLSITHTDRTAAAVVVVER